MDYYGVPRETAIEDVAEDPGCARATAAEHLGKAEPEVPPALFGGDPR